MAKIQLTPKKGNPQSVFTFRQPRPTMTPSRYWEPAEQSKGWAFVDEEATTRTGEKLQENKQYCLRRWEFSPHYDVRSAIQMGAGLLGVRMEWEPGHVRRTVPPYSEPVTTGTFRLMGEPLHRTAVAIAQDKVALWYNTEKYDEQIGKTLDQALDTKLRWVYYEVDDLSLERLYNELYSLYLQERRALRPGRNPHKTSPTVNTILDVTRAVSPSWLIARGLYTESYSRFIEEQFMSFYTGPPSVKTTVKTQRQKEREQHDGDTEEDSVNAATSWEAEQAGTEKQRP